MNVNVISWLAPFAVSAMFMSCESVKDPEPYGVLPSDRQLEWHEMDMYCLIHYTPTTFQNKEWGYGDAPVALFNPSGFDANQIAAAAAAAGFKGLISVAKHHDGFCLWPTSTTSYNISQSPWKDGKGDMVKEFADAARNNGLKFGIYLSAWDRNDTRYGSDEYPVAYREQLTELMSNYGSLFASWHDGANGGDGYYGGKNEKRNIDRTTYYSWTEKTWPIVRKLQPNAMIFSDVGPDMRWVGNENGFAAQTSWATITPKGLDGGVPMPGAVDDANLSTGDRNGEYWIPAECDVPQRPGWFYHPDQDTQVKTPEEIFEIYFNSVGRGGNMNLGLAPMPEGKLHENDVRSLHAFGEKVKQTFAQNLADGASITADNIRGGSDRFGVKYLLDDDRYSYYASDDDVLTPTLEVALDKDVSFDIVQLRENIKLGQRLDSVVLSYWDAGEWKHLAKATSIGANRLIKLPEEVTTTKVRIQLFAPVAPTLSDFGLFKEQFVAYEPVGGQEESKSLIPWTDIKALDGLDLSKALDNDPDSFAVLGKGQVLSLTASGHVIQGVVYVPRQDGNAEGMVLSYEIEGSNDGKDWKSVKSGEFSNIIANPIKQEILLDAAYKYVRFKPTRSQGNSVVVAEIALIH